MALPTITGEFNNVDSPEIIRGELQSALYVRALNRTADSIKGDGIAYMYLSGNSGLFGLPTKESIEQLNGCKSRDVNQAAGGVGDLRLVAEDIDVDLVRSLIKIEDASDGDIIEFLNFVSKYCFVRLPLKAETKKVPEALVQSNPEGRKNFQMVGMHGQAGRFIRDLNNVLQIPMMAVTSANVTGQNAKNLFENAAIAEDVSAYNANLENLNYNKRVNTVVINSVGIDNNLHGTYTIVDFTQGDTPIIMREGNIPFGFVQSFFGMISKGKNIELVRKDSSGKQNISKGMTSLYGASEEEVSRFLNSGLPSMLNIIQCGFSLGELDWEDASRVMDLVLDNLQIVDIQYLNYLINQDIDIAQDIINNLRYVAKLDIQAISDDIFKDLNWGDTVNNAEKRKFVALSLLKNLVSTPDSEPLQDNYLLNQIKMVVGTVKNYLNQNQIRGLLNDQNFKIVESITTQLMQSIKKAYESRTGRNLSGYETPAIQMES